MNQETLKETWRDAFEAWWTGCYATTGMFHRSEEKSRARATYAAGRDCGRAEMQAEVEASQAIVDKLPKWHRREDALPEVCKPVLCLRTHPNPQTRYIVCQLMEDGEFVAAHDLAGYPVQPVIAWREIDEHSTREAVEATGDTKSTGEPK